DADEGGGEAGVEFGDACGPPAGGVGAVELGGVHAGGEEAGVTGEVAEDLGELPAALGEAVHGADVVEFIEPETGAAEVVEAQSCTHKCGGKEESPEEAAPHRGAGRGRG